MSTKQPLKPSRPNSRDLARYEAFANAYLAIGQATYFNAERSAEAAGYAPGYVKGNAYELLGRPGVQEAMRRLRDERAKLSTVASPVEVLETLTAQMRMLPNKLMTNGELIPLDEMTVEQAHAIAGAKTSTKTIQAGDDTITETRIEYKFMDRQKAAVELGKHHGLFEKDNRQQKPDNPQPLVLMTAKPLTLAEWTEQANELQAQMKARQLEAKP
jgi:phage terminase small subunit